jgi:hypothetical protein
MLLYRNGGLPWRVRVHLCNSIRFARTRWKYRHNAGRIYVSDEAWGLNYRSDRRSWNNSGGICPNLCFLRAEQLIDRRAGGSKTEKA